MLPEENEDSTLAFARGGAPVRQGRPFEPTPLKDSHYDGFDQDRSMALAIPTPTEINALRQMGESLIASGLAKKFKTPEQALIAMLTGRELGLAAMASIRGIDVIADTPFIKPILMLAIAKRSGQLEYFDLTKSPKQATATVQRKGGSRKVYTVTIEQANQKGWAGRNPNYKTQPDTMLGHRATGEALKEQFADYFMGMGLPGDEGGYIEDFNDARESFHANDTEKHVNAGEVVTAEPSENGDEVHEAEVVNEFIDGEVKERAVMLANKLLDSGASEDELASIIESVGGVKRLEHVAAGDGQKLVAALANILSTRLAKGKKANKPFAAE